MFKQLILFVTLLITAVFTISIHPIQVEEEEDLLLGNPLLPTIIDAKLQGVIDRFDTYFQNRLNQESLPGAAYAIVKDSFIISQKAYGLRQYKTQDSVDINSIFRLASLSKGFAGVLTGLLVQDSLLDWDDKVIDYVPDLELKSKKQTAELTLQHLLSHSTGLPRHTYTNLLNMGVDYHEIKAKLKEVDLAHPVGTQYNYQNVIFSVIAEVMEEATGKPYDTLLQEYIFDPLDMKDASASFTAINEATNVAQPHSIARALPNPLELEDKYYSVLPAAGVNASISDMAKWLHFLLGNRPDVATAETLEQIFSPFVDMHRGERGIRNWRRLDDAFYAMGWRVVDYKGQRIIYHGGFVNGYRAEIAFCPDEQIGMVFLSNGYSQLSFDCMPQFYNYYLNANVEHVIE